MTTNYRVSNLIDRKGNAVQFKDKELRDKVDELKNIASSAVTIAEGAVDTANASAETVTEALSNITAAETAASGYASAASSSATEASGYVLAASGYATSAASSAASASESATSAGSSADLAAQSATSAANSAGSATSSASAAATSANAASGSATAAAGSASAADDSATAAAGSATSAASSATDARSYAIGGTGTRTGEDSDNAEYYSDLAADSATAAASSMLDAEAWAKGTRNGSPVGSTDDTYHANAKYYADAAQDVLDSIPQDYSTMSSDVTELKRKSIGVKYTGMKYGSNSTTISGSVGSIGVYRIYPNDNITIVIHGSTTSPAIDRDGIALSNSPTPTLGDTVVRVGTTSAITGDVTKKFVNSDGYKYCYVYYANRDNAPDPNVCVDFIRVNAVIETELGYRLDLNNPTTEHQIPSNTDLNSVTTYGQYTIFGKEVAKTLTNCPVEVGCRLVVAVTYSVITQIIYRMDDVTAYNEWFMYIRNKPTSASSWGPWIKMDLPTLSEFYGKKVSILGDSISTYADNGDPSSSYDSKRFAKTGDIYTYPGNQCRYPQTSLGVTSVNATYWMQVINNLGMTLGINESWAKSKVTWDGVEDTEKVTVDDVEYWANPHGADRHIASQTRINHLGSNGTPDFILVNAGTNDAGNNVTIGTVNYESPQNYTQEEIAALPVATFADAYRTMLIRLMYTYPNAKIICMTPSYRTGNYAVETLDQYIEIMKEICDMFGIPLIDTRHSGISILEATSSGYLPDGTHYNATGMSMIAALVIKAMKYNI